MTQILAIRHANGNFDEPLERGFRVAVILRPRDGVLDFLRAGSLAS